MEFLNLLQSTIVGELAKVIVSKGVECKPTPEDVFANLSYVYEEIDEVQFGQPTGNKMKYMPKQFKHMVMRLISPTCSIRNRSEWFDDHVSVEAFLYYDRNDSQPIASAKSIYYFENMVGELTDAEKRSTAELAARGYATSKVLQEFGIGAWFKSAFEPEENPELVNAEMAKRNDLTPTVAVTALPPNPLDDEKTEDKVETKKTKSKKETNVETEPITKPDEVAETNVTESVQDSLPLVSQEETPVTASKDNSDSMSFEDARAVAIDLGRGKQLNLTVGDEMDDKRYINNLAWVYKNTQSDVVKEAIRVVARKDDTVMQILLANAIEL